RTSEPSYSLVGRPELSQVIRTARLLDTAKIGALYAGRLPASPVDPRTHGVLAVAEPRMGSDQHTVLPVAEPRMGSVARAARTSEKKKRRVDARNDYPIQQADYQRRDPLGKR